jgi:hypothetical protein
MVVDESASWGPHDGWILLAVVGCGEAGGTLRDIIAVADYVNHAVPSFDDLAGGLGRLAAAGLVASGDDRYVATRDAFSLCDDPRAVLQSPVKKIHALERSLAAMPLPAHLPVRLSRSSYDRACAAHLEGARRPDVR